MLVQSYRREVPTHDAFVERTLLRDARFAVAVVRARGIAIDHGVIAPAVKFVTRMGRPQLTILLAGRGYIQTERRLISLSPGDVVESDQRRHQAEGYAGTPSEVIIVDWEEGSVFDGLPKVAGRRSSIGVMGAARLRDLVRRVDVLPPKRWIAELIAALRGIGAPIAMIDAGAIGSSHPLLERLFGALGRSLSRLDTQPCLVEIAGALETNERRLHRAFGDLARLYAHPFETWRDLLHEMRLDWVTQLLSLRGMPLATVASLAGYRSTTAMFHAFSSRGAATPGTISRRLAQRWH